MSLLWSFLRHGAQRPRLVIAGLFGLSVLALTGAGVYAGLAATATGTASVRSGTLSLSVGTDVPSAGFPQTVSNMAPGDSTSVLIKLNNNGTISNSGVVTLGATVGTSTLLDSSATKGLQVSLTECSQAWSGYTLGASPAPTCGGTTSALLPSTSLASVVAAPVSLSNVGALATAGGSLDNILFTLTLPDQSETTVNGILPSSTIQGLSDSITWTFTETQRAAQNTNG